jgi:lysophospholipase L1-like esterase
LLLPGVIALLAVTAAGCRHSGRATPPERIVAFGDSITRGYGVAAGEGWVERLSDDLRRDPKTAAISVFNAGGNANTSAEGLARFDRDVLPHLPALVLVEFGGNDAVDDHRHVGVDRFEENLREIHHRVTTHGGEIILVTFPPVIDAWHVSGAKPYYLKRGGLDHEVERYRERTRTLAREMKLPLFDLDQFVRRSIATDGAATWIDPDGVHLTPAANRAIADRMLAFLRQSHHLPPRIIR